MAKAFSAAAGDDLRACGTSRGAIRAVKSYMAPTPRVQRGDGDKGTWRLMQPLGPADDSLSNQGIQLSVVWIESRRQR